MNQGLTGGTVDPEGGPPKSKRRSQNGNSAILPRLGNLASHNTRSSSRKTVRFSALQTARSAAASAKISSKWRQETG